MIFLLFYQIKDSSDRDSVVIPKKTLLDLITHSDVNMPRTIVLQRGKKGFGFVLRGAKAADVKFEPTPEIPALQFLENVDKGSNAEKAGLKPFDFVIEVLTIKTKILRDILLRLNYFYE